MDLLSSSIVVGIGGISLERSKYQVEGQAYKSAIVAPRWYEVRACVNVMLITD